MRLLNKNVLVTGASRGIGKAIALQVAKEGANVAVHYHLEKDNAEEVVDAIQKMGVKACLLQADLNEISQAVQLGNSAWEQMGNIHLLVNNAGISYKKHFLDATPEDADMFLNINYKAPLFLTQTIASKMVKSNIEGSIISITSVNGITPGLGLSVYGASKGALETLMKGAAVELSPHNIKVNTIAVGAVETYITAAVRNDPALLKEVNEGIPLGRIAQPQEIAVVVADILASGSYLTGATITLDGGLLLMRGYGKPKPYKKND
jgi:glucose 1-dehydrogenase